MELSQKDLDGSDIPLWTMTERNELGSFSLVNHPRPYLDKWIKKTIENLDGVDQVGDPIFRISWGQEVLRRTGYGVKMVYPCQTYVRGGEFVDVGIPRWIVEVKIDPAMLNLEAWKEDIQGNVPHRGQYIHHMTIQTPDGWYCLPDNRHLTRLREMIYHKRKAFQPTRSDEATHEYVKRQEMRDYYYARQQKELKRRAELRGRIKDYYQRDKNRICSLHPDEGKRTDPFTASRKMKLQALKSGGVITKDAHTKIYVP